MGIQYFEKRPNYNLIYNDILDQKYPEKRNECEALLKKKLSVFDIIELNNRIFDNDINSDNQRYRSYGKFDIYKILDYQKVHSLNNSELSKHFKISRNTVMKWKKLFKI